ncbi:TPA: NUDIX domain-containing protein, partial [Candidatus Woesearchaeota archaeon]|nr:NUDIX domain-containing protein [Candidatus Woesearchaeota archaeon]
MTHDLRLEEEVLAVLEDGSQIAMPKSQSKGYRLLTAHVILRQSEAVLLTQRTRGPRPDCWDVGITETMRRQEKGQYKIAAVRGLQEELGITVPETSLALISRRWPYDEGDFKRLGSTFELHYAGRLRPNSDEIKAIEWVTPTRLIQEIAERSRDFRGLS